MVKVPTINMDSEAVDSDTLALYLEALQRETLDRTKLMCGNNFGIVSQTSPKIFNTAGSNPLWVSVVDQYSCRVYSGACITASGRLIKLSSDTNISLVSLTENAVNVVFLQAEVVSDSETVFASTGEMVSTGTHIETTLRCLDYNTYIGLNTETREDTCVLAFVVFKRAGNSIVYESDSTWLRPWFSSQDREHRSRIGSGDVTESNPHGLGFNELTTAGLTIIDHLTSTGMILSKDSNISGVPGYLCFDDYEESDIKTDTTGQITKKSFFGGIGAHYLELKAYPNMICRVLGVADVNGNQFEYPCDYIPGSRILVFFSATKPTAVTIHYTRTPSLSIISETASSLTFNPIDNRERVISSGLSLATVKNTTAYIRRYGGIPVELRFQVNRSGEIEADPKVLVASKRPTEVPNNTQNVLATFLTPCYIGVGASRLGEALDILLAVKLTGTDNQGNAVEEILEFDKMTWEDTLDVVGVNEKHNQILYTKTSWSVLTSYEVLSNATYPLQSIDPSGYIQVYAKLDPARHKNAIIATAFWNGRQLKRISDSRRVLPVIRDGIYGQTSITSIGELIAGVNEIFTSQNDTQKRIQLIVSEDFQQPKYLNAPTVIWHGRELLDVDPLPQSVVDSALYTNVYRSRNLPVRKLPEANLGIIVVLHNVDTTKVGDGSVRVVLRDELQTAECSLNPYTGDFTRRTFIAYFTYNWKSVSFVISGKCQGFSAYYVNPKTIDVSLIVEPETIWTKET